MTSGMISSYLEGSIFEQIFGGQGISTMHILNYANKQGIPVYTINQDNVDTVLPELEYSEEKKQEFRNLVNNGKKITIPKEKVTINGWNGTGYIVLNSDDGTGAYMISGGLAGGRFIDNLVDDFPGFAFSVFAPYGLGEIWGLGSSSLWIPSFEGITKLTSEQWSYNVQLQAAAAFISLIAASAAIFALIPGTAIGVGFATGLGVASYLITNAIETYRETLLDSWTFLWEYFYCIIFEEDFNAMITRKNKFDNNKTRMFAV